MINANDLKKKTEDKMKAAIVALQNEFKKIRTGRAQITMLDSVRVDYVDARKADSA